MSIANNTAIIVSVLAQKTKDEKIDILPCLTQAESLALRKQVWNA